MQGRKATSPPKSSPQEDGRAAEESVITATIYDARFRFYRKRALIFWNMNMKVLAYLMAILFLPCHLLYWFSVWEAFGILLAAGMLGIAVVALTSGSGKSEPLYRKDHEIKASQD